jgi:hypothetical protein
MKTKSTSYGGVSSEICGKMHCGEANSQTLHSIIKKHLGSHQQKGYEYCSSDNFFIQASEKPSTDKDPQKRNQH